MNDYKEFGISAKPRIEAYYPIDIENEYRIVNGVQIHGAIAIPVNHVNEDNYKIPMIKGFWDEYEDIFHEHSQGIQYVWWGNQISPCYDPYLCDMD